MSVRSSFLASFSVPLYDKASLIIARSEDGASIGALCQRNRLVAGVDTDASNPDDWVRLVLEGSQPEAIAFECFDGGRESGGFAALWLLHGHACVLTVPIGHRQVSLTRTKLDTGSWCVSSGANGMKEKWVPAEVLPMLRPHRFLKAAVESIDH